MCKSATIIAYVLVGVLLFCSRASALIVVPRDNPNDRFIHLKQQYVNVDIVDGVSETTIEQVFHNNSRRQLEGDYLFPIPEDASISSFSMWMGGVEVQGEILPKDEAAARYRSIVRRLKDPGLLEYVGKGLFQAHVFPIPAYGDVRIKVHYQQVLPYDNGAVTYRFTSEDPVFYRQPIMDYRVSVSIRSKTDIKAVYSPTHRVEVDRRGSREANVLLTRSDVARVKDFILYYTISPEDFGLSLLTHYDRREHQGYFVGLIAPDLAQPENNRTSKNVIFVLDVSGSMAGEKIKQAKEALRFCLNSLDRNDRFGIVSYSDLVDRFSDRMLVAGSKNVRSAIGYVDGLTANGGTDINSALLDALSIRGNRAYADYIIFLTDGEPTIGETDTKRIIENARQANVDDWTVFSFGVGYDVDAAFLDELSSKSNGLATYVRPGEDVEVNVSNFFAKIANPAMTDIRLVSDGVLYDIYPRNMTDLFYGMQLVVAGRYRNPGGATVSLEGYVNGKPVSYKYNVELTGHRGDALVPRQWAIRRVGFLLEEIGKGAGTNELKDEIIRLSKEYGIVTPYTSFFVDEPKYTAYRDDDGTIMERGRRDLLDLEKSSSNAPLTAEDIASIPTQDAIDQLSVSKRLSGDAFSRVGTPMPVQGGDGFAPATEIEEEVSAILGSKKLRNLTSLGDRTFQKVNGVLYDSKLDDSHTVYKIKIFSEAYFELLEMRPEIGKYLTTGEDIVLVVGDIAIFFSDSGEESLSQEVRSHVK